MQLYEWYSGFSFGEVTFIFLKLTLTLYIDKSFTLLTTVI